jgi:hypothetical protein
MDISFIKGDELSRESLQVPADIYNKFHTLLSHAKEGFLFVPIRTLQYLAVIDEEEVLFVDGQVKHIVVAAWDSFKPQVRKALSDPVPYDLVVYQDKANDILPRLQGEFFQAIELMASREKMPESPSNVTSIHRKEQS